MGVRRWWRRRPRTVVVPLRPVVAASPESFATADNWAGGFYELALEYAGAADDGVDRVALLAQALGLDGCYGRRDREPTELDRLPYAKSSLRSSVDGRLYGLALLPNGRRVVCAHMVVAENEEDGSREWQVFYLPLGALGQATAEVRAYPFDEHSGAESLDWREPIDSWLADAARRIFATAPFRLGIVGLESSFLTDADELAGADPPSPREFGYLIPDGGGVRYLPAEF